MLHKNNSLLFGRGQAILACQPARNKRELFLFHFCQLDQEMRTYTSASPPGIAASTSTALRI